ncbi:MAG TPA: hypothetical protein VEY30_02960 [Myxococcaceae bacterium]|nr:hypothetical protein [Myxococcaceae bacterium]
MTVLLSASPSPPRLDVQSANEMELRVRGDYLVTGPGDVPVLFEAPGPGQLVLYVMTEAGPEADAPVPVDVRSEGVALFRESVKVAFVPGLRLKGGGRAFRPHGLRRVSLPPLPKQRVYEVRLVRRAALAAFWVVPAPKGIRIPEVPVRALGGRQTFGVVGERPWHWGSVCDRVRLFAPGPGEVTVEARMQLGAAEELPPPSFMRVTANGKVKGTTSVAASPEPGLEFGLGRRRYGVGSAKALTVYVNEASELEVELAAWGCVNGVGFQFAFRRGATAPPGSPELAEPHGISPESSGEVPPAPPLGAKKPPSPEALAQCSLLLEDVSRARANEYLNTLVATGAIPASRLAFDPPGGPGDAFRVQSVVYRLDALEVPSQDRQLLPGPHTLEAQGLLSGTGAHGPIRVVGQVTFTAEAGKRYRAWIQAVDRDGPRLEVRVTPDGGTR